MRHRPIGIGVQGFADALMLMRFPFESDEAVQLNKDIFETMYFGAVTASMEEAKDQGNVFKILNILKKCSLNCVTIIDCNYR